MEDNQRRFFRARRTCCQMLMDRGYVISETDSSETFPQFQARLEQADGERSKLLLVGSHAQDPNRKTIVCFSDETKKTGVKPIQELKDKMQERGIQRAILVTQNVLTPFARRAIDEAAPKLIVESFLESELLVNITKHDLVPQHVPLSDEEKQSLLQRYRVKEVQLPRIQQTDPVSRYFGLAKGQVVKIIRSSETAGRYVTYRVVT